MTRIRDELTGQAEPTSNPVNFSIVGAGTAGLASAIFLARQGHRVTVYEAFDKSEPLGAGLLIQPSGQRILSQLGVFDELQSVSARVDALRGYRRRVNVLNLEYKKFSAAAFGLGVHRAQLQRVLMAKAEAVGVTFRFDAPVTELDRDSNWIIANGTRSELRRHITTSYSNRAYPWGAFWLICDSDAWPYKSTLIQKYGEPWHTAGVLPTGVNPQTGKTCYSIFWSIRSGDFPLYRENGLELLAIQLKKFWPEAHELFENSAHSNSAVAEYADTRMQVHHNGNRVIIGDAAHSMSPQLGQGANLALIDAGVLANCLAEFREPVSAFAAYTNRRRRHLWCYRWTSRALTPLYQSRWPLGLLRDAGTLTLGSLSPTRALMLKLLSGYAGWDVRPDSQT